MFSSSLAALGILWLVIFHVDLCIYKREVLKQLKLREESMQEAAERFSTATEFIINSGYRYTASYNTESEKPPPYRFLQGRHSGSFYLKVGSAGNHNVSLQKLVPFDICLACLTIKERRRNNK